MNNSKTDIKKSTLPIIDSILQKRRALVVSFIIIYVLYLQIKSIDSLPYYLVIVVAVIYKIYPLFYTRYFRIHKIEQKGGKPRYYIQEARSLYRNVSDLNLDKLKWKYYKKEGLSKEYSETIFEKLTRVKEKVIYTNEILRPALMQNSRPNFLSFLWEKVFIFRFLMKNGGIFLIFLASSIWPLITLTMWYVNGLNTPESAQDFEIMGEVFKWSIISILSMYSSYLMLLYILNPYRFIRVVKRGGAHYVQTVTVRSKNIEADLINEKHWVDMYSSSFISYDEALSKYHRDF